MILQHLMQIVKYWELIKSAWSCFIMIIGSLRPYHRERARSCLIMIIGNKRPCDDIFLYALLY